MTPPTLHPPPIPTSEMSRKNYLFSAKGEGGGYPFTENSAKIIKLIFEPLPKSEDFKDKTYDLSVFSAAIQETVNQAKDYLESRKKFWKQIE